MASAPHYAESLLRLLAFIGGVASTIVGSWLSSKIHVYHDSRKAHLEDLKQKVLVPLRDAFSGQLWPLAYHLVPVISVQTGATTGVLEKATVTQPQTQEGDALVLTVPIENVFGRLDFALLQDARKTHFRALMARIDSFVLNLEKHTDECYSWVRQMAEEILSESTLPAFPNRAAVPGGYTPYVMHYRLAMFVYKRLFGLQTTTLEVVGGGSYRTMNGEGATLALGSTEPMQGLLQRLNAMLESEAPRARTLRDQAIALQKSLGELTPELAHATASRRLRKRCDLVAFF